jgi:hypothetical protein
MLSWVLSSSGGCSRKREESCDQHVVIGATMAPHDNTPLPTAGLRAGSRHLRLLLVTETLSDLRVAGLRMASIQLPAERELSRSPNLHRSVLYRKVSI